MVPGAANALAARVIEQLGFEAVYLSGAGLTNTFYGLPDLGFVGLADIAQHTAAIRDAVALPIIVDADTGFGNALNVRHTRAHARARRRQRDPARGPGQPQEVRPLRGQGRRSPLQEMVGKVKAAVDARQHADFLVIARTDAAGVRGHRRRDRARRRLCGGRRRHDLRRGARIARGAAPHPARDRPARSWSTW